jgi:hypothetical protein
VAPVLSNGVGEGGVRRPKTSPAQWTPTHGYCISEDECVDAYLVAALLHYQLGSVLRMPPSDSVIFECSFGPVNSMSVESLRELYVSRICMCYVMMTSSRNERMRRDEQQ